MRYTRDMRYTGHGTTRHKGTTPRTCDHKTCDARQLTDKRHSTCKTPDTQDTQHMPDTQGYYTTHGRQQSPLPHTPHKRLLDDTRHSLVCRTRYGQTHVMTHKCATATPITCATPTHALRQHLRHAHYGNTLACARHGKIGHGSCVLAVSAGRGMASTWAQMRLEVEMKVPKLRADASWPSRFHSRPVVHTRLRHPPSPVSTLQAHAPPQPSALCLPTTWQWQVWQGVQGLVGVLLNAATYLCARSLWAHMPIPAVGNRGLVDVVLDRVWCEIGCVCRCA